MSDLYKKLVLPEVDKLIKYSEIFHPPKSYPNSYKVRDAEDLLTPYAFEFFRGYGLEPTFVIDLIPKDTSEGDPCTRMIHADTTSIDGVWTPLIGGINFEIYDGAEVDFHWFDMSNFDPIIEEKYYDETEAEKRVKLRGITYGPHGLIEGAILMDKLRYGTTPYLVRTDLPHMVTYNNTSGRRHGVSIRFKQTWTTWEECCKAFEPLMSK